MPGRSDDNEGARARRWPWALAVALAFAVLVGPMVALESRRDLGVPLRGLPSEVDDQDSYHWGVVLEMSERLPGVELVSYNSATTPGYHLSQAVIHRLTGSRAACQAFNALIGLALALAVFWALSGAVRPWLAALLTAPCVLGPYVLGGSIWMTTDNFARAFVVVALGLVALRRFTPARGVWAGVACAAAVLVRQVHVWPAAAIGLAGLLRSPLARWAPAALRAPEQEPRSWRMFWAGVAGAAIGFGALGAFVALWGGLLPRVEFIREMHSSGADPAAFPFALALVACLAPFFLAPVVGGVRGALSSLASPLVWACGAAGLLSALSFRTDWIWKVRDYGWLWRLAKVFPEPGGRNLLLVALAPLGGMALAAFWRSARAHGSGHRALLLLLTMSGFVCAQAANTVTWQRYFEPMTLIGLAMLAALGAAPAAGPGGVRAAARWAPVALLGAVQLALSGVTLYREFLVRVL